MRIYAVNNNLYNLSTRDNVTFTNAWWSRKPKETLKQDTVELSKNVQTQGSRDIAEISQSSESPEVKADSSDFDDLNLNANEMIFSLRLADMLHRLDDKSLIYIASPDAATKAHLRGQLVAEKSFIPKPKDIKDVYLLNLPEGTSIFAFLMIAKDGDHFKMYGSARNVTVPNNSLSTYIYNNIAHYGDVVELESGNKFKFIKTRRESNEPMYDAKYPVESFLSDGHELTGGVVLNRAKYASNSVKVNNSLENIANRILESKNNDEDEQKSFSKPIPHRTFKDVAGMDETIEKVKKQILYPMIYPKAFHNVTNCGTIFYGPPGTGKTLLAQAIIGEAKERKNKDIHFINIDGQALDTKWIGDTEDSWRKVFKEAVDNQPCILFIDEIDAVLSMRSSGETGGERHRNSVVSQFLTLISDIEKNNHKILIIGATNRPELIDSAIKRAGRIGEMIEVKKPDEKGCLDILNYYLKDKNISEDFDRESFAKELYNLGYTGADIANLVNDARNNMYERRGIYEQMDNGTFQDRKLDSLQYEKVDFEKTIP